VYVYEYVYRFAEYETAISGQSPNPGNGEGKGGGTKRVVSGSRPRSRRLRSRGGEPLADLRVDVRMTQQLHVAHPVADPLA